MSILNQTDAQKAIVPLVSTQLVEVHNASDGTLAGRVTVATLVPPIPAFGTTAGTIAQGNDSRIVGAAPTSSLAAVATSGSYNDLINKPTIPASSGPAAIATATASVSASSPSAITVTPTAGQEAITISSSGAITVPSDVNVLLLINSSTPPVFTLPAGAFDQQRVRLKRFGAGAFTVSATMDGLSSASLTTGSGLATPFVPLDDIVLVYSTVAASWLID